MRRGDVAAAATAFAAMEGVAYLAHRCLMHGPGWGWHRSHHVTGPGRWQRNDRYPLVFATATVAAMAVGSRVPRLARLLPVGAGVTAYGAAYALAHDVYVHRRLPVLPERVAAVDRLRVAHERHHASGGEPYGFLLPVTGLGWRRPPSPAGPPAAPPRRPSATSAPGPAR